MELDIVKSWLERVKRHRPLIECLTNQVTMADVANVILSAGASPVMGLSAEEVEDFVTLSSAVVINVGTMTSVDLPAYQRAMECAQKQGKPVVLDPVGVGAATFRTGTVFKLLETYPVAAIRGNASEIKTLCEKTGRTQGVDAAIGDLVTDETLPARLEVLHQVARQYHCIVAMSGAIDLLSDGQNWRECRRGVPWMAQVTGTGCSLTGLVAAFIAVSPPGEHLDAANAAFTMMGTAGERAFMRTCHLGLGSFHTALLDELSLFSQK